MRRQAKSAFFSFGIMGGNFGVKPPRLGDQRAGAEARQRWTLGFGSAGANVAILRLACLHAGRLGWARARKCGAYPFVWAANSELDQRMYSDPVLCPVCT